MLALGQLAHLDGVAFDPLTVRMLGREGLLDLLVRDDAAGKLPAAGAEAVAVEQRADLGAVSEDDVRRTVPRFDQRIVVFVERPDIGVKLVVLLPCRRQHHGDGMWHGTSGQVQQFEAFVERAGIGVARGSDRQQRLEFAEQFGA